MEENDFVNVICKMAAILSLSQCDNLRAAESHDNMGHGTHAEHRAGAHLTEA